MSFGDLPYDSPADQPPVEQSPEEQSCQEADSCDEQADESHCDADESGCDADEPCPATCDSESDCDHEAAEYDSGAEGIVICGGESPCQSSGEPTPYEVVATLGVARSESGAAQPEAADPVENPYVTDNSYTDDAQPSGKPKRQRFSRLFSGMRKKNQ